MYPIIHQLLRILFYMISLICSSPPPPVFIAIKCTWFPHLTFGQLQKSPSLRPIQFQECTNKSFLEISSKDTILPTNSFICFKKSFKLFIKLQFS